MSCRVSIVIIAQRPPTVCIVDLTPVRLWEVFFLVSNIMD